MVYSAMSHQAQQNANRLKANVTLSKQGNL